MNKSINEILSFTSLEAHILYLVSELINDGVTCKEVETDGTASKVMFIYPNKKSEKKWKPVVRKIDQLGRQAIALDRGE